MKQAILLILFNRKDKTKKLLDAVLKSNPEKLYVACDGPRTKDEKEKVDGVRNLIEDVGYNGALYKRYQKSNLGCALHVSSAISWFFENEESGIILEDDCIPSVEFFHFMEKMLPRYRNDNRVGLVSGMPLFDLKSMREFNNSDSYIYSNFPNIWGWGTWREFWSSYDLKPEINKTSEAIIKSKFKNPWLARVSVDLIKRASLGEIDTWDYQVSYLLWTTNRLVVLPKENLVSNIGFGSDATHTKREFKLLGANVSAKKSENDVFESPVFMSNNQEFERLLSKRAFIKWARMVFSRFLKYV